VSKLLKQSQTAQPLLFLMISSTDHVSGVTGLSPTVTISKNGGAFAAPAGAVTEVGLGWYKVAGNATDSNTLGPLLLHATGTGADPCDERFDVVAFDPQSATSLGLTNLDATVSSRSTYAGADTGGTTTLLSRITGSLAPTTGDAYARIGLNGAGLTAIGDTRLANLDATVSSRSTYGGGDTSGTTTLLARLTATRAGLLDNLDAAISTRSTFAGGAVASVTAAVTVGGYSAGQDPATLVLDATASSHNTSLTIGNKINSAASAGDPWATSLPGAYASGTAGYIVGTNLNATVSSRLASASYTAPTTPPTAIAIRQEIDANSTRLLQLAGAFEGSTSVFSSASLANAPTGSGGSGGMTLTDLQAELDTRLLTTAHVDGLLAVNCGDVLETKNSDGSVSSQFRRIGDHDPDSTPVVTAVTTQATGSTTRTVSIP
jgi:hypothetical protein